MILNYLLIRDMKKVTTQLGVNFNNLRVQSAFALDRLVETFNRNIDDDGEIKVHVDEIEDDLNELISKVRFICCVFEEGNDDFKDLSEEIGDTVWFNGED